MKKFFKSKYFYYWIFFSIGWSIGRIAIGGKFDDSVIGGVIVGAIAVAIIAMVGKSRLWTKFLRK